MEPTASARVAAPRQSDSYAVARRLRFFPGPDNAGNETKKVVSVKRPKPWARTFELAAVTRGGGL
jgi:hypothetical protein